VVDELKVNSAFSVISTSEMARIVTTATNRTPRNVTTRNDPSEEPHDTESAIPEGQKDDDPYNGRSRGKVIVIMLALGMAVFLGTLDGTIVTTALPTITEHFGSASGYTWIGSAFLLANASTIPSWGKASDIFGRKPMLLLANVIFMIGSLVAALSNSLGMLIAARAVQGLGSGGLVIVNIAVGDLFGLHTRGACYGLLGAVWALASSVGPMIGGSLTQGVGWRWCFWINLPLDGLAFVLLFLFLDLESPKTSILEGLKALDLIGSLLVVGATTMFLLGVQNGGVTFPWGSAIVICLIVSGVFTFGLFILYEWKTPRYPIMPLRLFKTRNNVATLFVAFIHGIVFISGNYYLPLYFQSARGASPILSGVYILPTALALSLSCVGTGIFLRKVGNYLPPTWFGLAMMTLGYGLFVNLNADSNWTKLIIYQVIAAIGCGPLFQTLTIVLQTNIEPHDIGTATATLGFIRQLATSISIVIGQVVFQDSMSDKNALLIASLGSERAAQLSGGEVGANVQLINALPGPQKDTVRSILASSLQRLWIMYAVFSAGGFLTALLIKKKVLESKRETMSSSLAAKRGKGDKSNPEKSEKRMGQDISQVATSGVEQCH
jgi:EmrB/QacA subfamily drug resistance transporter